MKLYAHSIIKRPISDVYNYLADVRNDGHWRDDIILSEIEKWNVSFLKAVEVNFEHVKKQVAFVGNG